MCGFRATPTDQQRMRYLIQQLAPYNPTAEPAAVYYNNDDVETKNTTNNNNNPKNSASAAPSLSGAWTLLYTDAPDILGLGDSDALARLQRIGQDCNADASTITNVIEWIPPVWAGILPGMGGSGGSNRDNRNNNNAPERQRILQKVVTQASSSPQQPNKVNLRLKGLQVTLPPAADNETTQSSGIIPQLLQTYLPLKIEGPLTAPFGSFEILYLDNDIRIVRTGQGYYAINKRNTPKDTWF